MTRNDRSGARMGRTNPLTIPGSSIVRQVVWLAIPVLIEQALLYLVGLSDTILTGRYLSEEHLAAVTVASYLLWFLGSLLDGRLGRGDRPGGPADRLESARVGAADRPAGDAHGLGRRRPDDGAGDESGPLCRSTS